MSVMPSQIVEVPEVLTGRARRLAAGAALWRETFTALHHRNFRLFFLGQLVSLTGTWIQNTAQSWLVYQLTGSKLLLGVVAAAGSASALPARSFSTAVRIRSSPFPPGPFSSPCHQTRR